MTPCFFCLSGFTFGEIKTLTPCNPSTYTRHRGILSVSVFLIFLFTSSVVSQATAAFAPVSAPWKSQATGKGEAVKVEARSHILIAVMNCPPLNSFRTSITCEGRKMIERPRAGQVSNKLPKRRRRRQ